MEEIRFRRSAADKQILPGTGKRAGAG